MTYKKVSVGDYEVVVSERGITVLLPGDYESEVRPPKNVSKLSYKALQRMAKKAVAEYKTKGIR